MNYIGSKKRLLPFIKNTIYDVVGNDLSQMVFCDMFAGTGIVGRSFKSEVKQIIANDCEYYSYVLNKNYIENHTEIANKQAFIDELNSLPLIDTGFVYQNYCIGGGTERRYFSDQNGKKIDTIRQKIEEWKNEHKLSPNLYFFLLASLLESADKVANTTSVYSAFLKHYDPSAKKELMLQPADFVLNENEHKVFCLDSNRLIEQIEGDILYLDPPYNDRQYGASYHLLNTIARYDNFEPRGKTGLREYAKSLYCSKIGAQEAFEDLIEKVQFNYIFLSYNNEGIMPMGVIRKIMERYGKYDFVMTDYQRYKADKDENRNYKATGTKEYLHILEKKN
jgi:adenine-specific DNA-methyltransferase